jgi:hypothetical protein
MKYTIPHTDTSKTPITIETNSINTDTILNLYGQGSVNYGADLWINLIKLLDNTCSGGSNNTGPSKPIEGQLWHNNYSTNLNLYKTTKWVPLVDNQYLESLYGTGGIAGLIKKLAEALLDNTNPTIIAFIAELNKTLIPLTGGTVSGKLYLPKINSFAAFYDKTKTNDENKVATIEYLKWFVLEFAKNYVPPNSPGFDDNPFGIGYDTDPLLLPEIPPYLPLNITSNTSVNGGDISFTNTVIANKSTVETIVDNFDAVNKKYVDDRTSSDGLMNILKNSTPFKNAISSGIDNLINSPTAPGGASVPTLKSYSVQDSVVKNGKGVVNTDTGLTLTITPKAPNSKFLISISLVLANGTISGTAVGSLYKNDTLLLNNFCIVDGTNLDAMPYCVSYIDSVDSTDKITYTVKVNGNSISSEWFLNQSADGTNKSTSSMTIMEFVGSTTITNTSGSSSSSTIPTVPTIIGAEYNGGFYIGDITDDGVKYRLILSPKSTELNFQYITTRPSSIGNRTNNTPSRTNGPGNTAILSQSGLDGFLAAWYCSKLNINGYDDWYLPAVDELLVMSVNRRALIAGPNVREWISSFNGGGDYAPYSGAFYWSSTDEESITKALKVNCRNFSTSAEAEIKETVLHVRAIRREPY